MLRVCKDRTIRSRRSSLEKEAAPPEGQKPPSIVGRAGARARGPEGHSQDLPGAEVPGDPRAADRALRLMMGDSEIPQRTLHLRQDDHDRDQTVGVLLRPAPAAHGDPERYLAPHERKTDPGR